MIHNINIGIDIHNNTNANMHINNNINIKCTSLANLHIVGALMIQVAGRAASPAGARGRGRHYSQFGGLGIVPAHKQNYYYCFKTY